MTAQQTFEHRHENKSQHRHKTKVVQHVPSLELLELKALKASLRFPAVDE